MKAFITINVAPLRRAFNAALPYFFAFTYGVLFMLFVLNLRFIFRIAIETLKFLFN